MYRFVQACRFQYVESESSAEVLGSYYKGGGEWKNGAAFMEHPGISDVKVIVDLETGEAVPYEKLWDYYLSPTDGCIGLFSEV